MASLPDPAVWPEGPVAASQGRERPWKRTTIYHIALKAREPMGAGAPPRRLSPFQGSTAERPELQALAGRMCLATLPLDHVAARFIARITSYSYQRLDFDGVLACN